MTLKHEESQDIEEQFILRLPQEQAYAVRKIIHSRGPGMKDKLKIGFAPDGHHAVVQVEDVSLPAKLVNLPCVIGSLKTVDRKTFYKTADISQMLVCSAPGEPHSPPEEPVTSAHTTVTGRGGGKTDRKRYNWKHGITPPLKNIRKKRFRRTRKKLPDVKQTDEVGLRKDTESPNVDKEVKRLLCSDAEAVSVRWEVIADDETKEIESQGCISGTLRTARMRGRSSSETAMLREMFGDSGSNSNDVGAKIEEEDVDNQKDGDQDDDDDDDEDDEEEEEEKEIDNLEENLERELQIQFIHPSFCETNKDYSSIITGIQKLIHVKEMKLQKIYKKAQRQKDLLRNVENLTLKRHFQYVLGQLNILEKQKCEEIYHLQEQLKCYLKE
ncbi:transcription initiation factor TFIID subunit 7-like [Microtus oregoni]|uniref:transcription initiation factor TFIID subunit 7-like n=1 Tax=Microtus oregoni TaxID=111838 RepID=UPI001BB1D1D4|nr:transcription initiation factor TFIID subunit 7-like [Microtus oregoni]